MTIAEALQILGMTENSIHSLDYIGLRTVIMNNSRLIMRIRDEKEKQRLRIENEALEILVGVVKEYKYEQECTEKLNRKLMI